MSVLKYEMIRYNTTIFRMSCIFNKVLKSYNPGLTSLCKNTSHPSTDLVLRFTSSLFFCSLRVCKETGSGG